MGKKYKATPMSKWCNSVLLSVQFAGVFWDDNIKSSVSARLETNEVIASCYRRIGNNTRSSSDRVVLSPKKGKGVQTKHEHGG
ncbi:hypothetical protein CFC21_001370 [Triticum aestivum]|uniref:Uncharacterized protein n=2 Tax=Triticum TaxID=4564 RepID=A0A9R0UU62_TRITD|nr:hypothetical protein CFC21_001370 [Triticum aestivum]VAH03349.1 unnamed protein product [Triticum turgidum subsp. durum]